MGAHRAFRAAIAAIAVIAVTLTAFGFGIPEAAASTVPSVPRSVAATAGPGTATVTWRAPSSTGGMPIDRYRVVRSAPGVPSTTVTLGARRRSLIVTDLTPGTTYSFKVQAHNARGWSRGATTTGVPNALAGFGTILGACGVVAPQLGATAPSLFGNRSFDFGQDPYDDGDRSRLTPGAQAIFDSGNAGGSALISQIVAFETLARCEQASLVKLGNQIAYDQVGPQTDLLVDIAGEKVGVEVARAVAIPPGNTYTSTAATTLLDARLDDINQSTLNVADQDAWVKQVLVIMAYDPQHAEAISTAWSSLDAGTRADTIVYVVVTDGSDANVYFTS